MDAGEVDCGAALLPDSCKCGNCYSGAVTSTCLRYTKDPLGGQYYLSECKPGVKSVCNSTLFDRSKNGDLILACPCKNTPVECCPPCPQGKECEPGCCENCGGRKCFNNCVGDLCEEGCCPKCDGEPCPPDTCVVCDNCCPRCTPSAGQESVDKACDAQCTDKPVCAPACCYYEDPEVTSPVSWVFWLLLFIVLTMAVSVLFWFGAERFFPTPVGADPQLEGSSLQEFLRRSAAPVPALAPVAGAPLGGGVPPRA